MMHITLLALAAVPRLSDCAQIARYRRVSNAHAALRCSSSRSAREMRLACPNLPEHHKRARLAVERAAQPDSQLLYISERRHPRLSEARQIGRASWRESGCPYV